MKPRAQAFHIEGRQQGVSLIEILVALAIAALLLLGLSQIFIGSKLAYTVQAGMSRSQENARFIFSFLEDNVRMAGYYGCGNETDASLQYYNHVIATPAQDPTNLVRFSRPVEGFDFNGCNDTGCSNDGTDIVREPSLTSWTPALTGSALAATDDLAQGSDVLVLRVLSAASTPLLGTFNPTLGSFNVAAVPNDPNFVQPGAVYAISNCRPRMDIFKTSPGSTGTTVIGGPVQNLLRGGGSPNDTWGFTNAQGEFQQPPLGTPVTTLNAELHKAEYMAIFVSVVGGNPVLKIRRYANGAITTDEFADGVESMQVSYGIDADGDGLVDSWQTAAGVNSTGTVDPIELDAQWRRVVSVRVALLMRSQDRGGTPANAAGAGNEFVVGAGPTMATMTRPADARFRDVYETTIAIRNRLTSF